MLMAVLGLAAYLRLAHIGDNPGWYTDEATHLLIGQQLLKGRSQYLAINQSTLLFARLPLFEWLLAGMGSLFGLNMFTLRVFTAVLTLLTLILLTLIVWRTSRCRSLALLTALLFAIYPQAVIYDRFSFSYHLLTPLFLIALTAGWHYWQTSQPRYLIAFSLTAGLATLCDLWAITLLPLLGLIVWRRQWRDLWWSLPLALLPFGVYTAVSLLTYPAAFIFDLQFSLFRANAISLPAQMHTLAHNVTTILTQDVWFTLGLIGLFLMPSLPLRRLCLLFLLLPLVIIGRTAALYGLSSYYLIPVQPLIAWGMAHLLHQSWPLVWRTTSAGLTRWPTAVAFTALLTLLLIPFIITIQSLNRQIQDRFVLPIDPFLINPQDARRTAAFLQPHLTANDMVIASPTIAWLLPAQTADFQLAVAANGQATPHLPANIPPDRYVFDPGYQNASFIIIDNLWRNWGLPNVPTLAAITQEIETNWPLVYQSGDIAVYANPRRAASSARGHRSCYRDG
jgi:hypothetical protein